MAGTTLAHRIAELEQRIDAACRRSDRDRNSVTLVAVSKKKPASLIREAYGLGLRHFGENYVQELQRKAEALADLPDLRWHFIGHLQRNKAQQVVGRCCLIHSVDSISLLDRIEHLSSSIGIVQQVLIQLNLAAEPSKSGANASELAALLTHAQKLEHVRCAGLMTIPPPSDNPEQATALFAQLRQLRDNHALAEPMRCLSIGMSHDFEVAIAQRATHIRVGSLVFGPRD